jgi:sodium/proline symporter
MDSGQIQILIVMVFYMLVVIGIGIYYAKRANKSSEEYFLGGRSLGPWIAAMSAEASDMSGWLLMGLPGVAYWCGLSDAFWTMAGLAIGTYLNWLLVAKRLRRYSVIAGNAITIPEFFNSRFHDKKNLIMGVAGVFILIFFSVYAASCFVTCGKLFNTLFGLPYQSMMILGAAFVVVYTFLGGFLAESASDFMQGVVMIVVMMIALVAVTIAAGGPSAVIQNIKHIPGFFELFGIASPTVVDGVQQIKNGAPLFGDAGAYGFLTVISTMSWGLGYFGMPQVLLRFMAIRHENELKKSRRIATTWAVISMIAAVFIGIAGRALFPAALTTASDAESVYILVATRLMPALIAGLLVAGILAATISSSDSYLLIASSAVAKNIYQGLLKRTATDKQVMRVSRVTLVIITIVGIIIALDKDSVIFKVVSFAWAGFGATFGPLMLFSLFWKRTNHAGAVAGMCAGAAMVFIWKLLIRPMGGVFGIYELLPAFLVSCIFIVVVSLLTAEPSKEMQTEFEAARAEG